MIRPGGLKLTDMGVRCWGLPVGAKVLDIGCGRGETVAYLARTFGFRAMGLDPSPEMVAQGRQQHPGVTILHQGVETIAEFPPGWFQGVTMECVLSLLASPRQVLQDIYNLLCPGGKIMVSDLFLRDGHDYFTPGGPDEVTALKVRECKEKEAAGIGEGSGFCRRINLRQLVNLMETIGYRLIVTKDCSETISSFVAEKLLRDGTLGGCFFSEELSGEDKKQTGYFMMTATKLSN